MMLILKESNQLDPDQSASIGKCLQMVHIKCQDLIVTKMKKKYRKMLSAAVTGNCPLLWGHLV